MKMVISENIKCNIVSPYQLTPHPNPQNNYIYHPTKKCKNSSQASPTHTPC